MWEARHGRIVEVMTLFDDIDRSDLDEAKEIGFTVPAGSDQADSPRLRLSERRVAGGAKPRGCAEELPSMHEQPPGATFVSSI